VFQNVFMLRKYLSDLSHVLEREDLQVKKDLLVKVQTVVIEEQRQNSLEKNPSFL